uniref:Ig-like domain-containing protein n=1 Tax=Latimeria chalumnae TaxID=7897 RepID=H3B1Q6_LATCH
QFFFSCLFPIIYRLLPKRVILGDSIQPQELVVPSNEGETVTLTCTYSTSYTGIYLYWYRKYPNRAPEFILLRGAKSYTGTRTADFAKQRFDSKTSSSSTRLTVKNLELGDAALYYCALLL